MTPIPDRRAGLDPRRLLRLMREAVARCRIDLRGRIVLTEAATGSYVVTPILAALAGASRVYGLTRASAYGSVEDVFAETSRLARLAGVEDRVEVVTHKAPELIARADIVTNSGHVRPIDRAMIECMRPGTVISLMYEPWELRHTDVDIEACRLRGIRIAGTNESHPNIDVFGYLGLMAVRLLADAGIATHCSRIVLLCDNAFGPFLRHELEEVGARIELVNDLLEAQAECADAVLVAQKPRADETIGPREATLIAERWPGAVVAQFWGDLDRAALAGAGVPFTPCLAPRHGHMGILLSALGPDPVIRLQAGGLKVAEVLKRDPELLEEMDRQYVKVILS